MKKGLKFLFSLMLVLLLFGCKKEERTEPIITGLPATATIVEGESIDVLEGVTATTHGNVEAKSSIVITVEPTTATITGSVIKPTEPGSYLIKLTLVDPKDKTLTTTKTLFLEVTPNVQVTEKSRVIYNFDELSADAFEGFVAKEKGIEVDALTLKEGALVYTPLVMGSIDHENQLFKLLSLNANTTYTVSLDVKANKALSGVAFVINGQTPGEWSPYAGSWGVEIGTEVKTLSHTFAVETTNNAAELLLNIGGNANDVELTVLRLVVIANSNPQSQTLAFTDLIEAGDGWTYVNDAGTSTAAVTNGKAVINITTPAGGIWEQKMYHKPLALEANKVYKLSYTIHATEDIKYEYIARTRSQQSDGRDENYIWSGPSLPKDETRTVVHTFTTNDVDINDFDMFFQFGNQTSAVIITISNVVLTAYDDFSENVIRFSGMPEGFGNFEMNPSSSTIYVDVQNGLLVYDVDTFSDVDWHNKIYIENVSFKDGSKYQIIFEAYASADVKGFFAINPMGQWNPKVTDVFQLTTTKQTFTYETTNLQLFTENIELLFQFGSFGNPKATIYFDSIIIVELSE